MIRSGKLVARLATGMSAVALASLCVAPCAAMAADAQAASEKTETVTVSTDASGAATKVEVQATLKNGSAAEELVDISTLGDIKGDDKATYHTSGTDLIWLASGKDVSYKGVSSLPLPITMKVTYTLNGEAVPAEMIAGKTGDVTIRYDFENNSEFQARINGSTVNMHTPFTCVTALMLDGANFTDVRVTNGKIVNDGSDVIVAGYAMPGLKESLGALADKADVPEYFEVSAKATDFELKSTMTIVTAGLMSDMDIDTMGFDDLDDTSSGLSDAMGKLVSGSSELASGMSTLADGARQLSDGADELATGASSLSGGLYLLAYGDSQNPGLAGAASSTGELVNGLAAVDENLTQAAEGIAAASAGLETVAQNYPQTVPEELIAKMMTARNPDGTPVFTQDEIATAQAVLGTAPTVKELSAAISQGSAGLSLISTAFSETVQKTQSLPAGLQAAASAAKQLYAGSTSLSQGASEFSSATSQLSDGVSAAATGSDELTQGLDTFNKEGISKIVDTIDNDLGGLKQRLKALSNEAKGYDNFAGKEAGTASSVKFVYETAAVEAD